MTAGRQESTRSAGNARGRLRTARMADVTDIFRLLDTVPLRGRWAAAFACTALIAWGSLTPSDTFDTVPYLFEHEDKVVHAVMYGVYLLVLAWPVWRGAGTRRIWGIAAYCVAFGALMEALQPVVQPGDRTFSPADMAANAGGAVTAALICASRLRQRPVPTHGT